jgi:hypothetical protein
MAGPTAAVLSRDPLDSARIAQIHEILDGLRAERSGSDFWIDGRPFFIWFGEEYEGEMQEIVHSGLPKVLGWIPRDCVGFAAMCNDRIDHELLGRLCITVAQKIGGIVDLSGTIPTWPDLPAGEQPSAMKVVNPNGLRGTLFVASYLIESGWYGTKHYTDASLLESWLTSANFRMVK